MVSAHHQQQQNQQKQQQQQETAQLPNPTSSALVSCQHKPVMMLEILNKIQSVINSESALPQFIYFARNMDEMRKKWLQAELRCQELERKCAQASVERNTLYSQLTELKIDIEMQNEKRQAAESERDRLAKQMELFKDILVGNKHYSAVSEEDRRNLLSSCPGITQSPSRPFLSQQQPPAVPQRPAPEPPVNNRRSIIDDTGFIISDYTADDINLTDEDEPNTAYLYNSRPRLVEQENKAPTAPLEPRAGRSSGRESLGKKRSKHHSSSLTRNDQRDKKRSRTRSTELQRDSLLNGAGITAITTVKLGEAGGPITVTSEIQHAEHPDLVKQQSCQMNGSNNKMEIAFSGPPIRTLKNRKRPSREFLHRSADESESTEDSEIFWNGSEEVAAEAAATVARPPSASGGSYNVAQSQVHVMTPIVEAPTPTSSVTASSYTRHHFNRHNNQTPCKTPGGGMSGCASNSLKALSANSIPLARKYKKAHVFKGQVILNSELCAHCDKRTKFGKMIMKCRECELVVHTECKELLQRPCYSLSGNFPHQGSISDYAPTDESPRIPPLIQMIVNEIESRGLTAHEVGLYRVNGSDTQIKQFKERLFKRHQVPDLRKIVDIHVLCSFLKDFLNNLTEHLVTYDAWYRFAKACDIQNETDRLTALQQAVEDLPVANRDTLAFVVLHLQRLSVTAECKMPASNIARVFGPSLIGNSAPNMSPAEIINELKVQQQIVENLIKIPSAFYATFVEGVDQQQRLFKNPPKTPETMRKSKTAVVLSSILGPAANIQSSSNNLQPCPTTSFSRMPNRF